MFNEVTKEKLGWLTPALLIGSASILGLLLTPIPNGPHLGVIYEFVDCFDISKTRKGRIWIGVIALSAILAICGFGLLCARIRGRFGKVPGILAILVFFGVPLVTAFFLIASNPNFLP